MLSVIFILIALGLVFHIVNNRLYIYYYLFLYFIVPYLLTLLFNLTPEDNEILTNYSPIFLIFVFIVEAIRHGFRVGNKRAFVYISLLFLYATIFIVVHNVPFKEYLLHFFVSFLAPLFCISNLFYWLPPHVSKLNKAICAIFIFNLVLFLIQRFTGFLVLGFMKENLVTFNSAAGVFSAGNSYSAFMMLFLCYILFVYKDMEKQKRLLLIFLTTFTIVLTGVRTYLLCSFIFLPICWILIENKKIKPIKLTITMVLVLIPFYFLSRADIGGNATRDAENSLQRQFYGLAKFSKGEGTDEKSTMFLSAYVFSEYFIENPLFGNWKLYTPSSYGIVSPENQDVMDAGLAVYLSDIGIIGMILYILFQIKTIFWRIKKDNKRYIWLFYSFILLSTYTDIGIFGGTLTCFTFIVSYLVNKEANNSYLYIPHERKT